MKRLFLIIFVAAAFAACGDGTGDTTNPDSTMNAPADTLRQDPSRLNDTTTDTTTTPRDTMNR